MSAALEEAMNTEHGKKVRRFYRGRRGAVGDDDTTMASALIKNVFGETERFGHLCIDDVHLVEMGGRAE